MASFQNPTKDTPKVGGDDEVELSQEFKQILISLPKEKGWRTPHLYQYQGHWCQINQTQAIITFQNHFTPQNTDIILTTIPRSGTIWLKSMVFAIVNRGRFAPSDPEGHPLLTGNPHELVPFFDYHLYVNNKVPDLSKMDSPRLFATHVAYELLPEPVRGSGGGRIVYMCRNPMDNFVSMWHLQRKLRPQELGPLLLEDAFDMYCRGVVPYGPYMDHMLGYWKESQERPDKVLFLKYEDVKADVTFYTKKLAEFLGFSFTEEEEREGVIEEISQLCSFRNMKESDNKRTNIPHLRKGEVGDWVNHLTPTMVDRLDKIMEEKLSGSGLYFKVVA